MFRGAIGELQKTITMKLYSMDHCNKRYNEYINRNGIGLPIYTIKTLTNAEIDKMSLNEVVAFTEKAEQSANKRGSFLIKKMT